MAKPNASSYTEDNFTAMQAAGIVILPAAGYYYKGDGWYNVGNDGYYWSSTSYKTSSNSNAYNLNFYSSDMRMNNLSKSNGYFSVRLVQNL